MKCRNQIILLSLALLSLKPLSAQNYFDRLKQKAQSKIDQRADRKVDQAMDKELDNAEAAAKKKKEAGSSSSSSSGSFTDPSKYGKVIMTLPKDDVDNSSATYLLNFQTVEVVNNSLKALIYYGDKMYDYDGGKLTKSAVAYQYNAPMVHQFRSEKDRMPVDFSELDMKESMLQTGKGVESDFNPAKPYKECSFRGKKFATYIMAKMSHNEDSSVIAVAGMQPDKKFTLSTSKGQVVEIPEMPYYILMSPDGNKSAAFVLKDNDPKVYTTDKKIIPISDYVDYNKSMWLHNSGNIFSIDVATHRILKMNNQPYHTFDVDVDPKTLFISDDAKRWAYVPIEGQGTLLFSDGTSFESAYSTRRVTMNNKDYIIFLTVKGYDILLCQREL